MYRFILAAILAIVSTSAPSATVSLDPSVPTVAFTGVVSGEQPLKVGEQLMKYASEGVPKVQMIINSPGGSVIVGMGFLSMMRAAQGKGLKVVCFVPQAAASMAYQVLLYCDERHTLNSAFLLWHRARVNLGGGFMSPGVAVTAPMATQLARELTALDDALFSEIRKRMGNEISHAELTQHFEAETLHLGVNLHKLVPSFITTHDHIPGLFETLDRLTAGSDQGRGVFRRNIKDVFEMGEFIYITDKLPTQENK